MSASEPMGRLYTAKRGLDGPGVQAAGCLMQTGSGSSMVRVHIPGRIGFRVGLVAEAILAGVQAERSFEKRLWARTRSQRNQEEQSHGD